ncbi:MAG: hypothetical protein V3U69_02110 [Bacteroidota bacterium]
MIVHFLEGIRGIVELDEPLRTPHPMDFWIDFDSNRVLDALLPAHLMRESERNRRLSYSEQEDTQDSNPLMHVKLSSLRTKFFPIYERSEKMQSNGAVDRENLP